MTATESICTWSSVNIGDMFATVSLFSVCQSGVETMLPNSCRYRVKEARQLDGVSGPNYLAQHYA
jgi:hypothetical protein